MVTAPTAAVVTPVSILVVATTAATVTRATVLVAATAFTAVIPMFATRAAILVATLLITTLAAMATMPATVMAMTAMTPVLALLTALILVRGLGMGRQRKGSTKCQCKKNGTLHNLLSFNSTLNTLCRMATNVRENDVINGIRTTSVGNNGYSMTGMLPVNIPDIFMDIPGNA
ncbi:hypothetical protein AA16373_0844 [Komagataeibacter swingsii DSM 16373]|nr:hypothetical protein AA16373_0844 [Komagataeibacter swingsii DSM 16373]